MRTIRYEGFEPAGISILNYIECNGVNYHIGDRVEITYLDNKNGETCFSTDTGILNCIQISQLFPSEARIFLETVSDNGSYQLVKSIKVVIRTDIISSIKMINKKEE